MGYITIPCERNIAFNTKDYKINPHLLLLSGVAKHQEFKLVKDEPPNQTNVAESLDKLKGNDKELKELNLNNIKVGMLKINSRHAEFILGNIHFFLHFL